MPPWLALLVRAPHPGWGGRPIAPEGPPPWQRAFAMLCLGLAPAIGIAGPLYILVRSGFAPAFVDIIRCLFLVLIGVACLALGAVYWDQE